MQGGFVYFDVDASPRNARKSIDRNAAGMCRVFSAFLQSVTVLKVEGETILNALQRFSYVEDLGGQDR